MNNKESCAKRIRDALSIRNMTQADLCRKTGIKKSAMSQYCNGGLVPRQDRTFLIAAALDVSEAWLMGFDVPMERQNVPASIYESGHTAEFVTLFMQLTETEQKMIVNQIKGILSAR